MTKILSSKCILAALLALAGYGTLADDKTSRLLLIPLVVDGDGIQSRLLITNILDTSNPCALELVGPGLDTDRFEDHHRLTLDDVQAMFELEGRGDNLIWATKGEQNLTFGYARLECAQPVTAQLLFIATGVDGLVALSSMSGKRKSDKFQFTLMPHVGSLAFVIANDMDSPASCMAQLKSPYGSVLREASIPVPAMASVFQPAEELFRIPEDYTAGAVRVVCNQELAANGILLEGGKFSILPPAVLAPPMISISGGTSVTEGGDAVFTITANASSAQDLTLTLMVSDIGDQVGAGDLGEKQVTLPAGRTSVGYIVPTIDDSSDEVNGMMTVKVNPAEGYVVSKSDDSARVAIRDNDEPVPETEPPVTQPPAAQPPDSQPPDTQPSGTPDPPGAKIDKPGPPSPVLTGVSFNRRPARGRSTLIGWETTPGNADLTGFGVDMAPGGAARVFDSSFFYKYIQIHCISGYTGNVDITIYASRGGVELASTVGFFCE